MTAPWTPGWGIYPTLMDDKPCVVTIDQQALAHGPVTSHPKFFGIRIPLQDPRPDGMMDAAERPAVDALADRLVADLVAAADAYFVLRYVTDRAVYLGLYVPEEIHRPLDLERNTGAYTLGLLIRDDAKWEHLQNLAPDAWQRQVIADGALLAQLRSLGDDASLPRRIDHSIVLPRGARERDAVNQLRKLGFEVTDVSSGDDGTVIGFSKVDSLHDVMATSRRLFELAAQFDGHYDGWGAPITK